MEIALLIEEYLKDKTELMDYENDSFNIVENSIFRWDFKNIPQPTTEELLAFTAAVETRLATEQAVQQTAAIGAEIRRVCNLCYDIIVGFNVTRGLSVEQVTQLSSMFAGIQDDLQNLRPWFAKPKIQAVAVDGVLVTQAMKDMVLAQLANF